MTPATEDAWNIARHGLDGYSMDTDSLLALIAVQLDRIAAALEATR